MAKYLRQKPDNSTLEALAEFICGDQDKYPVYRSSSYLTRFFGSVNINATHDGSTRKWWVFEVLKNLALDDIENVILRLVDIREYKGDKESLKIAVEAMGGILLMEDLRVNFQGRTPVLVAYISDENPVVTTPVNDRQKDKTNRGVEIYARNIQNNGLITSDTNTKIVSEEYTGKGEVSAYNRLSDIEWYEQWWAKYLLFPSAVIVIGGLVLWYLGIYR